MSTEPIPIACSLTPAGARGQLDEWSALRGAATEIEQLDTGVRIVVPAEQADSALALARREAACCAFLDIDTTVTDSSVVVTITSPDPDARPVIDLLAGLA